MIYGKISPTVKVSKQDNPFETPTVIEANYMGAMARPYGLGASIVNFEVICGNVIQMKESPVSDVMVDKFQRITSTSVKMTQEELAGWAENDSVVLTAIAKKLNISIGEFVTIEDDRVM